MASSRRRTSYTSSPQPVEELVDELSSISEQEAEVSEETTSPEPLDPPLSAEVSSTDNPSPVVEKVAAVEPSPRKEKTELKCIAETKLPKRHPRNIPKFSLRKS
jgi:hypothetical protein